MRIEYMKTKVIFQNI